MKMLKEVIGNQRISKNRQKFLYIESETSVPTEEGGMDIEH